MAGGPWVAPDKAMRHLVWSRTDIKGGAELRTVKAILPGMGQQVTQRKIRVEGRVNFLEVESAVSLEDPAHLPYPSCPIFQVVEDAEIEHGIHAGVRIGKMLRISNKKEAASFWYGHLKKRASLF